MSGDSAAAYLEEARRGFSAQKRLAEGAIAQVSDEELFRALDVESNSIAVIMKHMSGNLRSRFTDFLTTDGEKPDRHRDSEFVMEPATTRDQVLRRWDEGWGCLSRALDSLQPADLLRTVFIRGEAHTVLQALNRQLLHSAQHAGQIVLLAKHWKGAGWKPLSIPRGQSAAVNARMRERSAR